MEKTHIVRERFLAHSFQPESERESLKKNFTESETEGHFLEIDKTTQENLRGAVQVDARGRMI